MESNMPRPPQKIFNADLVEKTRKPAGKLTQLKAGDDTADRRRGRKKNVPETKVEKKSSQPTSPFATGAPPFPEKLAQSESLAANVPPSSSPTPEVEPSSLKGKISTSKSADAIDSQEVRDAANKNTDPKELLKLSKSKSVKIQEALASNPSTPLKALLSLAKTKDSNMAVLLIKNPSFPATKLAVFLSIAKTNQNVRTALKSRKNLPLRVSKSLEKMK